MDPLEVWCKFQTRITADVINIIQDRNVSKFIELCPYTKSHTVQALVDAHNVSDNTVAVYWRKQINKQKGSKKQRLELAAFVDQENLWDSIDIDALLSNCFANCRKVIGVKESQSEKRDRKI